MIFNIGENIEGKYPVGRIDVIDYFENHAPKGISTRQIQNAVNAYSTVQSWFTFYKIDNYGRIEQRPINSSIIYVKAISNGVWGEWRQYTLEDPVTPIGKMYNKTLSSNITLSPDMGVVDLITLDIPKGTYLLVGKLSYQATFTHVRLEYSVNGGSRQTVSYETDISEKVVTLTRIITFNEAVTLHLSAKGTGLVNTDGYINFIQAVRLK